MRKKVGEIYRRKVSSQGINVCDISASVIKSDNILKVTFDTHKKYSVFVVQQSLVLVAGVLKEIQYTLLLQYKDKWKIISVLIKLAANNERSFHL